MCPCPFHLTPPWQSSSGWCWRSQIFENSLWRNSLIKGHFAQRVMFAISQLIRMILLEVIWRLFLTFQHREQFVFSNTLYAGKLCTHHMYAKYGHTSDRGREMENNSSCMDDARGFLFSWLISLNLFDPNFKTHRIALQATFVPEETRLYSYAFQMPRRSLRTLRALLCLPA